MVQVSLRKIVERNLIAQRDAILEAVAKAAVDVAPVDTGAYVTSFSVTTSSGSGRSRTSHGKPRNQDPAAKKAEAMAQIRSDIEGLPVNATMIYLTNRAPHAAFIEGNGPAPMNFARSAIGARTRDYSKYARKPK